MEYLVHGEFAYKESDVNGTFGAWWVPLRKMIKELGKELVEQDLELMNSEAKQLRVQVIDNALENSSDDDEGGVDIVVYPRISQHFGYPGISWDIVVSCCRFLLLFPVIVLLSIFQYIGNT